MGSIFAGIALAVSLSGVSPASLQLHQPKVTAADFREVFKLSRIGRAGPKLNAAQMRWVQRVESNPYWRHRLNDLWYFPEAFETLPLIIFYPPEYALRSGDDHTGGKPNGNGVYQIIGDGCNLWFTRNKVAESVVGLPSGSGGDSWPENCFYDPLAKSQRESKLIPIPPPPAPVY